MQSSVDFVKVGVCEAKANAINRVEVVEDGVMKLRGKVQKGVILGRLWLCLRDWFIVHNRV